MSDKDKKKEKGFENGKTLEFSFEDSSPLGVSSDALLNLTSGQAVDEKGVASLKTETASEEKDPIFKELAEPKLPSLPRENRARLHMQSPERLYFYWSIKNNPFQTLSKALGNHIGNYSLVVKLINHTKNTEEVFLVEHEGNWWFNAQADSNYRAEIGFYAPNRPFIRIMFSNYIHTPRKKPSRRRDYTPSFKVDSLQFAEVLEATGYKRDAFEVAITGDDEIAAQEATQKTYTNLTGQENVEFNINESDEVRFAFLALASGYSLKDIRSEISPKLFSRLEKEINMLSSENIIFALKQNFDMFTEDFFEEEIGEAVIGASLINFPRKVKKRSIPETLTPKLESLDKFSIFSSSNTLN